MRDYKKAEARRLLEVAQAHCFDCRELIERIFNKADAEWLNNKLYRARIEINQVKDLIKD